MTGKSVRRRELFNEGLIMFRWTGWNETNTAELRTRWAAGESGELIAKHIGAPSRSAVIGKAYRLGLEQRATYQRKPMVRAKKAAVRMMPTKATRVSLVPISAEPLPPPHVTDIPRVSMRDVTDHQCKWPCDEFRSMTAPLYCGCKKVEGLPYCENHARRAYQVPGMGQKQIANPRQPQRQMAIQGSVVADLRTLEEAV